MKLLVRSLVVVSLGTVCAACAPSPPPPAENWIQPGTCFDGAVGPSGEQVGDVQYDGPANTAGNFRFSDSTDGSCSTLRADDANRFYAWLRASDEAAAASLCAAVAPGDLSGTAFQLRPVYATMPSDLWICGW